MKWRLTSSTTPQTLPEVIETLLHQREIKDTATFFNPVSPLELEAVSVGFDEAEISKACQRLVQARDKKERVLIFGDYDADGICATGVMWLGLREFGIEAFPFIPHREKHGYGVSEAALEDILKAGKPDLIITVDNGIVAHDPLELLAQSGIDVILTDHHTCELDSAGMPHFPKATAIVHTTQLCGTTVAWMLLKSLFEFAPLENVDVTGCLGELLDLCGIATIADQVQLRGANRSFAYFGIRALRTSQRPGILALCQQAKIDQAQISTYHVNYGLGPRINAMGRLEHGLDALRLLCTKNPATAQELAQTLSDVNIRRQELTDDLLQLAISQVAPQTDEKLLIVASNMYHEGIIGLIAGRLSELYHKPAIAIAVGPDTAKGSARSVQGVHITDLMRIIKDDLTSVGGHPLAGGFGLESSKLATVVERLHAVAQRDIDSALLEPSITIDATLPAGLVSLALAEALQQWEPLGQGNRQPLFALRNMRVTQAFAMGKDNRHLKLVVENPESGVLIDTIGWGQGKIAAHLTPGQILSLAGHVEINDYKGRRTVQMIVKDVEVG